MVEQNRKKIANNSVMLFIRTGITVIVSLFTSRIVLQQLGVSDFGVYNVVGGICSSYGFYPNQFYPWYSTVYKFFKAKEDDDAVIEVFSASLLILFVLSAIIILFGETVGMWFWIIISIFRIKVCRMPDGYSISHFWPQSSLFSNSVHIDHNRE